MVVLLGAIAWLVVRQVVTPVRMAAGIAERLSAGRLQERMKVTGEDDIARLGEAFNKMAQNLQLKIQQLEELSRMQRRFVSDVSHELRTPLTTVRMAADVIHEARVDFDPVTARSAELLGDQLDRFESLLSDLLEISRFDAGAAALEAEPIDLRQVVRRVIGGAEPLAERKGTRIRVVGDEQPVIAEADARRVERVLRNLVVNAVEHGEGRDVVVRMAVAGGAVAVAVRDYGVGLKPGEATRVFNRFWRADPARARTTGGTGLGLSIAVEDARLHGGWLQAWGEPGGGSQFRLTLPRTADEPLRGSPIPLEPEDSRRNRENRERAADGVTTGSEHRLTSVPAQQAGAGPVAAARAGAYLRGSPHGARFGASGGSAGQRRPGGRPSRRRPAGRRHRICCAPPGAGGHDAWALTVVRTAVDVRCGLTALLGCGIVLLSACGSMPVTGDVKAVDASQPGDSQVQVYAVPPRDNATPSEMVDGFLESMTSDDPGFRTTRKYLTKKAAGTWKPSAVTTVLSKAPNRSDRPVHDGDRSSTELSYTLTGEKMATVDAQSAYQPVAPTEFNRTLHLVRQNGPDGKEWRIDLVPDGLLLGQSDFKRLYRSVNKYYFATGRTAGQSTLVADPVYVRNRTDPVTRMDTVTQTVRQSARGADATGCGRWSTPASPPVRRCARASPRWRPTTATS